MYYQTAITAVNFLSGQHSDPGKAMSEIEYYAACVEAERRETRRAARQAKRARLARLISLITLGKLAKAPAQTATLTSADPHILDDLGISATPFGGQVLNTPEGQSEDLLTHVPTVPAPPIAKPAAKAQGKAAISAGTPAAIPAS